MELKSELLFDLDKTIATNLFTKTTYPWEVLGFIDKEIANIGKTLDKSEYNLINNNQWIHKTAKINELSTIEGSVIISRDADIRPGAYIRGNVIIGENVVVGNSTELKNSIIFNDAQLPHYNYVGDSIIGAKTHLGAGAICSNLKSDKTNIVVKNGEEIIETKMRKIGAIIGDGSEIGCGSVLNPGTIIGKNTIVYPLSMVRGVIGDNLIYKDRDNIISKNI